MSAEPGPAASPGPDPTAGAASDLTFLLDDMVRRVPGTRSVLAVSADGLLMGVSQGLDRTGGDQLAAVVAGLSSLTRGASRLMGAGEVRQVVVEMDGAFLFTTSVSDGSVLAVVADISCDIGLVGYEMTLLASRAGRALTPQLITELRARLPR
ncbi:MAG: Roadblock/LC7 protein, putative GTPase-activating (GAP) component of G-protein-coupled receptor (GPCR) system [uncultured Quadrisphaera sp.]|uniref:Roadblock/LC7 protein, putative GTPase-activating (GAP) component of G-protein-coupled receptor (GPCR) system n=1 Tax=uncultured Quadrisphaera sp. TaxID=904978 RepID=A0A6J4PZ70_9ACTN|nr:MAG: Roadblock/LC7 protein, putative GTPase-activating (GAP) component of G-protein-coupled receptor (GPCR) system [uncultured Quadrisphaera sp.]